MRTQPARLPAIRWEFKHRLPRPRIMQHVPRHPLHIRPVIPQRIQLILQPQRPRLLRLNFPLQR